MGWLADIYGKIRREIYNHNHPAEYPDDIISVKNFATAGEAYVARTWLADNGIVSYVDESHFITARPSDYAYDVKVMRRDRLRALELLAGMGCGM